MLTLEETKKETNNKQTPVLMHAVRVNKAQKRPHYLTIARESWRFMVAFIYSYLRIRFFILSAHRSKDENSRRQTKQRQQASSFRYFSTTDIAGRLDCLYITA